MFSVQETKDLKVNRDSVVLGLAKHDPIVVRAIHREYRFHQRLRVIAVSVCHQKVRMKMVKSDLK
jgi:hypothetical protein